jgi:molybdenum cofactor cytidylyltransferase
MLDALMRGNGMALSHDDCVTYRHAIAILNLVGELFVTQPSCKIGSVVDQTAVVTAPPTPDSRPHAGATRHRAVVVMLAAGAGSRFHGDGHKLSASFQQVGDQLAATVIERSLASALAADVGPVVVITGAVVDVLPDHLASAVIVRHNPRWNEGQITSVHAGIDAARSLGATSVIVGLADQPFIDPAAWRAVAAAAGPIVVATYNGRRGNPVKLDADIWELLPTVGDEGARALMRVRPELVRAVACPGSSADIDTTEDLRRWQSN